MQEPILSKLRLLIMPTKEVPSEHETELFLAYALWKEVWEVAFKTELDVPGPLFSDNFTRQSELAVIFYENEPVVLTTLNHFHLHRRMDLDDSYFKVWPELALKKMSKEADSIMSCGNLALNFKYRRGALGISAKDLIFYLLVKYLKYSQIDSMVAAVRLEKGMAEAAYRTGAHPIMKNVPYSIPGRFVDLVSWHRDLSESDIDPELKKIALHIWLNRTELVGRHLLQGVKHVA